MSLRIKNGYKVKEVNGQPTVVGEALKETIILDEISLFLWKTLKEKEISKNDMLDLLLNEFEISTVLALGEIDKFVRILKKNNVIE